MELVLPGDKGGKQEEEAGMGWYLHEAENGFENVIWADETTVPFEIHQRFCCRKIGKRPHNKPRKLLYNIHNNHEYNSRSNY